MDLGKALPEYQTKGPRLSKSPHCSTSLESDLKAVNFKTDLQSRGREEAADDQMSESVEKESCDRTNEECNQGSSEEAHEANSSPQFCSKHQRWVKSILQECPEECSDDLLRQPHASGSPPLFQSSSSRPSSQDLTPSDLIPCPADQQRPASDTSDHLQTPEKACEKANSKDHMTSGSSSSSSSASKSQPVLQPASLRAAPMLPPKVQLTDSVGGPELPFRAFPNGSSASPPNHSSFSGDRAVSSPPRQRSGNHALLQGATAGPPEDMQKAETDPGGRSASTSTVKEHPAANPHQPSLSDGLRFSAHLTGGASTSAGTKMAPLTKPRQRNVPVSSIQHTHASSASQQSPLRLSLPSQAVLLQSKLLQPCVSLRRLSSQHCHRATGGRSSASEDEGTRMDEEEDGEASFDLNRLYSSHSSSSSGGEDSTLWDSDYEPCMRKKRRV